MKKMTMKAFEGSSQDKKVDSAAVKKMNKKGAKGKASMKAGKKMG